MEPSIHELSDVRAIEVLSRVTRPMAPNADEVKIQPGELLEATRASLGLEVMDAVSEGELARRTLLLLSQDSRYAEPIRALVQGPEPERFALLETVGVVSAALLVLQTHVRIDRDKQGRWSVKVEKKPTSVSLLESLVRALSSFTGGQLPRGE